jgi:hypothetical protein
MENFLNYLQIELILIFLLIFEKGLIKSKILEMTMML